MMSSKKLIFLLSQERAIDSLAALATQVSRRGIGAEFWWPLHPGPVQGSYKKALASLQMFNPKWALKFFDSQKSWDRNVKRVLSRKHLVFAQTPYLEDHYSETSRILLLKNGPGYVGYGAWIFESSLAFALEDYKNFYPFLVANEFELMEYERHGVSNENMLITGIPGPYEVFKRSKDLREGVSRIESRHKPKLLWAPHWARGISTWESVLPTMVRFAKSNLEIDLIVRPHPMLTEFTDLELPAGYQVSSKVSQESQGLLNQLFTLENVELSSRTMADDCLRADWCVTEGVGIIAHWAATGKPLGVLRWEHSPEFYRSYQALRSAASLINVDRLENLDAWLEHQKTTFDPHSCSADLVSASFNFYHPEREPGRIFADWVKSGHRKSAASIEGSHLPTD